MPKKIHFPHINPLIIHAIIGVLSGFFLLHPITMVIYWFEFNQTDFTFQNLIQAFSERFFHAFHLHMMPMSFVFIVLGGFTGLGSGLYFRKIRKQGHQIQVQKQQFDEGIQSIIRNGENQHVGFKKSFRYDYRVGNPNKSLEDLIVRSIAGFMNANGGILVIGVDYDGQITGLADDYFSLGKKDRKGFEQRLMRVIGTKLGSDLSLLVRAAFHEINNREICSVHIEKANRPVYVRERENTVFYLRTGNVTKPLNTRETVEYLKANSKNF